MDAEEVITEKVLTDSSSNNGFIESTLNIAEDKKEDFISTNQENLQSCDNDVRQNLNNYEIIVIDDSNIEHAKESNITEPLQNFVVIANNDEHQTCNLSSEQSEQKNDSDIVHEECAAPFVKDNDKVSSLVTIAIEYGDTDSEIEDSEQNKHDNNKSKSLEDVHMQSYRQNVIDLSSEESDSEDDSTSSSDSSSLVESSDSDNDDNIKKKDKRNNTKSQKQNEMKSELDDLPLIEDLKISVPEVLCDPLGEVSWMVEQLVVVKPKAGKPTLNLDTVLFIEKGQRALGKIFDVFGQVSEPHYCVRFNSSEHIKECDIKVGMIVYFCPNTEYTSLVFLHELMKIKGVDATADEPPEFSDDEEERAYYEKLKAKPSQNTNDTDIPFKRQRSGKPTSTWKSNHPWNRTAQQHRKGYYPQADRQLYADNQPQNLWTQSYQNSSDQYGYGAYPMQPMQYMNHNVNSLNQNFYSPQNYYNEDGTPVVMNPRIPFNAPVRTPPGYAQYQNSNAPPNIRFQSTPWQQQVPQIPMRMKMPWVSLPPPPPPPPSSST